MGKMGRKKGSIGKNSLKRLSVIYKKVGTKDFSISMPEFDTDEFRQNSLDFSNKQAFRVWLSCMVKQNYILRISPGHFHLTTSALALCKNTRPSNGSSSKKPILPEKSALPEKLALSEENFELLEWLYQRANKSDGSACRVADRSRPEHVSDETWEEFSDHMELLGVLKVVEVQDDGERTYVINKERCQKTRSVAEIYVPSKTDKLATKLSAELHKKIFSLESQLEEILAQKLKLEERRVGVKKEIDRIKRLIHSIEEL